MTDHPASALLEVCVHTAANDVPPEFTLFRIEGPEIKIASMALPEEWQDRLEVTRELGTQWLKKNGAVLLRVPSVIVPATQNYLFNPLHRDAKRFKIVEALSYPFDLRIKG